MSRKDAEIRLSPEVTALLQAELAKPEESPMSGNPTHISGIAFNVEIGYKVALLLSVIIVDVVVTLVNFAYHHFL